MSSSQFAFLNLSTTDLLIILAVILLLFGAKRLPELARSIGNSAQELRKGLNGDDDKKQDKNESKAQNS